VTIDMTNKQIVLISSWVIIGIAIYFFLLDKLFISLMIMVAASFFRDVSHEKHSAQTFFYKKRKIIMCAKYYAAIVSLIVFIYTAWSILTGNQEFLKNYDLIGFLIFVILWPFVLLGLYHELILFKKYGK